MQAVTIPRDQWSTRLTKLSQAFDGWLVSLDVVATPNRALREFRQMPLVGITAEPSGQITIAVAEPGGDHLTHIIRSPTRVQLDRTDGGANAAIEIDSADGTISILRFRTTADTAVREDEK